MAGRGLEALKAQAAMLVAATGGTRYGRREGGQAGRERGGVARWRARAPATLPSLCRDEDDRGGRWAGLVAGWAGQLAGPHSGGAQVSSSC